MPIAYTPPTPGLFLLTTHYRILAMEMIKFFRHPDDGLDPQFWGPAPSEWDIFRSKISQVTLRGYLVTSEKVKSLFRRNGP